MLLGLALTSCFESCESQRKSNGSVMVEVYKGVSVGTSSDNVINALGHPKLRQTEKEARKMGQKAGKATSLPGDELWIYEIDEEYRLYVHIEENKVIMLEKSIN